MGPVSLYTIGYGQRSVEEFLALLKREHIRYLVDVRSQPFSRFNRAFSQQALQRLLACAGVRYVFMGDTLGGRPADGNCYTDGKVDYAKVEEKAIYLGGISRLVDAWRQQLLVAIMCSEAKPEECHRAKLISQTLQKHGVEIKHIDERGAVIPHEDVLSRLSRGQPDLFGQAVPPLMSRKVYRREMADSSRRVPA